MARVALIALSVLFSTALFAGEKPREERAEPREGPAVQEPPEEDESLKPQEYAFNPLQAEKELKIGKFYYKKTSYKAALRRFEEATKWNPSLAEAWLRIAETRVKLHDKGARDAYRKFLELEPQGKQAAEVRKKLENPGKG